MTPAEALAIPRRKNLAWLPASAQRLSAIPMLRICLTMTHVFEKIAQ
jgi:hypothetical protein